MALDLTPLDAIFIDLAAYSALEKFYPTPKPGSGDLKDEIQAEWQMQDIGGE